MTYLDMADTTYRGKNLEERRGFGRIQLHDSNTAFKKYLCIGVSDEFGKAHIRIHKGQAKQIVNALQKYIQCAEEK